jgi:hypothetical protein
VEADYIWVGQSPGEGAGLHPEANGVGVPQDCDYSFGYLIRVRAHGPLVPRVFPFDLGLRGPILAR